MKLVLGISNSLSQFLQKKDQNIIAAMSLVTNIKSQMQNLIENWWDELLQDVFIFCSRHNIDVPEMEHNVPGCIRGKNATAY